jgi:hypothetical protein
MPITFDPVQPINDESDDSGEEEEASDGEEEIIVEQEQQRSEPVITQSTIEPAIIEPQPSTSTSVAPTHFLPSVPEPPLVSRLNFPFKRPAAENQDVQIVSPKRVKQNEEPIEFCPVGSLSKDLIRKQAIRGIMIEQGYADEMIRKALDCSDEAEVNDLLQRLLYVQVNCQEQRSISAALLSTASVIEAIADRTDHHIALQGPLKIALDTYVAKKQIIAQLKAGRPLPVEILTRDPSDTTLMDFYKILMDICATVIRNNIVN